MGMISEVAIILINTGKHGFNDLLLYNPTQEKKYNVLPSLNDYAKINLAFHQIKDKLNVKQSKISL